MKRNKPGQVVQDSGAIDNYEYDQYSGSQKVSEVGRNLLPIPVGTSWTTTPTAATALPSAGKNVAVYNNSASIGTINFGSSSSIVSLAAGAIDLNGNVGLPVPPASWAYFAAGINTWVISSASTMLVFLINDSTDITVAGTGVTQNFNP
jgi:hypothetical protein